MNHGLGRNQGSCREEGGGGKGRGRGKEGREEEGRGNEGKEKVRRKVREWGGE